MTPLEFAGRAAAREASRVHVSNMRGLESLRVIARCAPWAGILGWLRQILESFGGMRSEGTPFSSVLIGAVAEGAVIALLGVLVALMAKGIQDYLRARSAEIDEDGGVAPGQ
jgi:biopolymer transport protein ExbB/TolQ